MSLATACPACSTVFRVVQDQLKVSEGWVRCGNCHKVFNAIEHLFDLDSRRTISGTPVRRPVADNARPPEAAPADQAPPPEAPPAPVADSSAFETGPSAPAAEAAATVAAPPSESDPDSGAAAPAEPDEPAAVEASAAGCPEPAPEQPSIDPDAADEPSGELPPSVLATDSAAVPPPQAAAAADADHAADTLPQMLPIEPPGADALMQEVPRDSIQAVGQIGMPQVLNRPDTVSLGSTTALPGFVREADRRARWQRPWVRAALLLLSLLLLLALLGQLAYRLRDQLAARWPQSLPLLQQACLELDCRIEPLRLIDAIVVDNTALTRPPGIDAYRLAVVLRNRAEHAVAAPHLELSLTDTSGAVVARRVFSPADFGIREAALAAHADSTWTLAFQTSGPAITGYTVSTFYP